MFIKFLNTLKTRNVDYDKLAEDCKELNFKISEFHSAVYDASVSSEERCKKARDCSEQFTLIANGYPSEVYYAVYYSHYEEIKKIREELINEYMSTK